MPLEGAVLYLFIVVISPQGRDMLLRKFPEALVEVWG